MSLTKQDLADIRNVVLEALDTLVNPRFDRIEAKLDDHSAILADHSAILAEQNRRLDSIEGRLDRLEGRMQALENDIKELYGMVGQPTANAPDKRLAKLSPEQQLRQIHHEVLNLARHMHVEL